MAGFDGAFGGGGGGLPAGTSVISPLVLPEIMELFKKTQNIIPTQLPSLQSIIQGGMNSPLLEAVMGPMLQRLQQPQAEQRQQLTDMARAAGGLRGSPYSTSYGNLLNTQGQQRNDLMAQVLQQILTPLISGQLQEQKNMFLPANAYTDLIQAVKPTIVGGGGFGSSSSSSGGAVGSFLDRPFSDPYAEFGLARPSGGMTGNGGGGWLGPNAGLATPWPNDMANLPISGGGGGYGTGGSDITYNPVSGMYESAPSNAAVNGDQWGFTPQDWANDPFYSGTTGDNYY